jgi:hypothetical protein
VLVELKDEPQLPAHAIDAPQKNDATVAAAAVKLSCSGISSAYNSKLSKFSPISHHLTLIVFSKHKMQLKSKMPLPHKNRM